jgi:myo-inositol-1(or 4)-monophosphatase
LTAQIHPGLRDRARAALDALVDAALRAGEIAARDFRAGERTSAAVTFKRGGSPVSAADLAANDYLSQRLRTNFPQAGWLSEETVDDLARLDRAELIVVDPIDGTRAFIAGDPRWSVSIAFVSDGRPIAGVVHAPALGETYAAAYGWGATRDGIRLAETAGVRQARPAAGGPKALVAAVSATSGVEWEMAPRIPSLALRLARVAGGEPDLAFASANSHDWDIAAADVILREAGAALVDRDGQAIEYNKRETRHGVLAALNPSLQLAYREAALAALRQAE